MMTKLSENIVFDAEMMAERNYWVKRLSPQSERPQLPTDYKRSTVYYKKRDSIELAIAGGVYSDLNRLTQESSFLLYSVLMTALKICLHWYTGGKLITVGSPAYHENGLVTGRPNLLAIADEVDERLSFCQLLLNVRDTLNEAYARQNYPFDRLVEDLGMSEIKNQFPIFDVLLVLREIHDEPLDVNNDLTITFDRGPKGLAGKIDFNPKLFCRERMERFAGNFYTLLSAGVKNIDAPIPALKALSPDEERRLLVDWNDTRRPFPSNACIHELFEAQVAETPDAVAVIYEERHLTYAEFNRRANHIAHKLRSAGVGPEVRVGICLERSLEMMVGVVACLKAGGAYVPLDPSYPEERLRFIMEDARAPVRLIGEEDVVTPANDGACDIHLAHVWEDYPQESVLDIRSEASTDNLIYVIYTSGSTGRPKGVAMCHLSITNLIAWQLQNSSAPRGARTLQFAPLNFDVSCQEMFSTWCCGGALVLISDEGRKDLTEMPRFLKEQAVERVFLPYVALQQLAVACSQWEQYPNCLREIITAGEQLQVSESIVAMVRHLGGVSLHNQYGPTESHVVSAYRLIAPTDNWPPLPPIGRPIDNAKVYALDHRMSLIPVGAVGDLYLGGACLARSYLNDAELTAEKFNPDPFSPEAGARLYKTGDLGRFRLDGDIEFIGRNDSQVKIRGFRVELGEIESILAQHPAVSEIAVIALEEESGRKRLVAYLAPRPGKNFSNSDLKSFCRGKLPEYSIPHLFIKLDALPLTPSGKINRRALPPPDSFDPTFTEPDRVYAAPGNEVESLLANIWSKVLRIENVGVCDNFFELGGDSILSLQIVAKARQAGLQLIPKQIFKYQTIADLAPMAVRTQQVQIDQAPVTGPVSLTPIQNWFFDQRIPDRNHWNMAYLLEAARPLDVEALRAAVTATLEHHDALRSRFIFSGIRWRQEIEAPDGEAPLIRIALSALPDDQKNEALMVSSTALQKSLSLSEGPVLRMALYDFGGGLPDQLLIIIHHMVVDGVSWRILLEDLQSSYLQITRGEVIQLPLKTSSIKQWAECLDAYERTGSPISESEYWLEEERLSARPLPLDYPEGDNVESSIETVSVTLQDEETRSLLRDVPRAHKALINDVLLTAVASALVNWTGRETLLIDLEAHGREELSEDLDLSRTVGWFTSIFPVILKLQTGRPIDEALMSVKEQLSRVPNKGINYGILRYSSGENALVKKLQALPRAQVSFNYLGQFDQALDQASLFSLSLKPKGYSFNPDAIRPHLLYISGGILRGRLQMNYTYSRNLYDRATIEGVANDFIAALRTLIQGRHDGAAAPYTIDDFPLAELSPDELAEVMKVEASLNSQPR
jgi:amino acid adenylation domain-containing protein/non-ribosomal peptide synthase protein (TIGR01720 family)